VEDTPYERKELLDRLEGRKTTEREKETGTVGKQQLIYVNLILKTRKLRKAPLLP